MILSCKTKASPPFRHSSLLLSLSPAFLETRLSGFSPHMMLGKHLHFQHCILLQTRNEAFLVIVSF